MHVLLGALDEHASKTMVRHVLDALAPSEAGHLGVFLSIWGSSLKFADVRGDAADRVVGSLFPAILDKKDEAEFDWLSGMAGDSALWKSSSPESRQDLVDRVLEEIRSSSGEDDLHLLGPLADSVGLADE